MFLLLISTSDGFGLVYNKKESYIYIYITAKTNVILAQYFVTTIV